MIKSKIEARERALELAVKCFDTQSEFGASNVVGFANVLEQYLIGSAELPEFTDDNAHIKELLEIANKSFDNSRKCNNDKFDDLKNFLDKREIEHLAKSKAELKKKDNI